MQVNKSDDKIIYLLNMQFLIILENRTRSNEWQVYFKIVIVKHYFILNIEIGNFSDD